MNKSSLNKKYLKKLSEEDRDYICEIHKDQAHEEHHNSEYAALYTQMEYVGFVDETVTEDPLLSYVYNQLPTT